MKLSLNIFRNISRYIFTSFVKTVAFNFGCRYIIFLKKMTDLYPIEDIAVLIFSVESNITKTVQKLTLSRKKTRT